MDYWKLCILSSPAMPTNMSHIDISLQVAHIQVNLLNVIDKVGNSWTKIQKVEFCGDFINWKSFEACITRQMINSVPCALIYLSRNKQCNCEMALREEVCLVKIVGFLAGFSV